MKTLTPLCYCFACLSLLVASSCATVKKGFNDIDQLLVNPTGKAQGNIDLNQLDGKWEITALYIGNFENVKQTTLFGKRSENKYKNPCTNKTPELFEFDASKGTYQRESCGLVSSPVAWTVNGQGTYVSLATASGETMRIMKLTSDELILEGNFVFAVPKPETGVYVLKRIK